ncbi:TPA: site-specific integrase, partial [Listeria innocua]
GVFPFALLSYDNNHSQKHNLSYYIDCFIKKAGIPEIPRIYIHILRHSHPSLLISMDENSLVPNNR